MSVLTGLIALAMCTLICATVICCTFMVGRAATVKPRLEHEIEIAKVQTMAKLTALEIAEREERMVERALSPVMSPREGVHD